MTEIDHITCKDCKFMVRGVNGNTCKIMFPNDLFRPAKKTFDCDWHGWTPPCKHIEPIFPQLKAQVEDYDKFIALYEKQWLPKPMYYERVAIRDETEPNMVYLVKLTDWLKCDIFCNGQLKATERYYYRKCKSALGYKLVHEAIIDGDWNVI